MRRESAQHNHEDGHPIPHPIVSSPSGESSLARDAFASTGAANDGAHTGTTPSKPTAKQRMQPSDIAAIADAISERDLAIVRSVAEHRFLTVRHVEALHFADHADISGPRIARRTLARLRDLRLLGTLDRRIGGVRAGSAGLVHYADVVGDQVLRGRSGRQARRSYEPSYRFLNHSLAIADIHVSLVEAERQGAFELVDCAVEPASWRWYAGMGGARLMLKPDLYVETATSPDSDLVHAWFVEVDLGTETIPTVLKKCHDYENYRRSGTEQAEGGGFPFVVWCMSDVDPAKAERRRLALREAIDRDRTLTPELFRIVAPDELVPLLRAGGDS